VKAILDTNVVIAGDFAAEGYDISVTSLTYAELTQGVSTAADGAIRAVRGAELHHARRLLGEGLPFDDEAAVSYGHITALVHAQGRHPRARRVDLMIAAIAHANGAAIITRNVKDFAGLETLVKVIAA